MQTLLLLHNLMRTHINMHCVYYDHNTPLTKLIDAKSQEVDLQVKLELEYTSKRGNFTKQFATRSTISVQPTETLVQRAKVFFPDAIPQEYDGEWQYGLQHGQGTMIYVTGSRYKGAWSQGKWHGEGEYTSADGTVFKGIWSYGPSLTNSATDTDVLIFSGKSNQIPVMIIGGVLAFKPDRTISSEPIKYETVVKRFSDDLPATWPRCWFGESICNYRCDQKDNEGKEPLKRDNSNCTLYTGIFIDNNFMYKKDMFEKQLSKSVNVQAHNLW